MLSVCLFKIKKRVYNAITTLFTTATYFQKPLFPQAPHQKQGTLQMDTQGRPSVFHCRYEEMKEIKITDINKLAQGDMITKAQR